MVIFHCLLCGQFHYRLISNQRHQFLPHMAGWLWSLHEPDHSCPSTPRGHLRNEVILFVPVRKALLKIVQPHVHQTRRKLLWVCAPPCTFNLPYPIFISDQSMAHWYYGVALSRYQWFVPHHGQRLQGTLNINSGLQELLQDSPQNYLHVCSHWMGWWQTHCLSCLLCLCQSCRTRYGQGEPWWSGTSCPYAAL